MTTLEETRILSYLQKHITATLPELRRACMPGMQREWVNRAVADLEWLGYVTVYYERDGKPFALEITERGSRCPTC